MQARNAPSSKLSATFVTLEEGFQQFGTDLNKLQVRKPSNRLDSNAEYVKAIRRDQRNRVLKDSQEGSGLVIPMLSTSLTLS